MSYNISFPTLIGGLDTIWSNVPGTLVYKSLSKTFTIFLQLFFNLFLFANSTAVEFISHKVNSHSGIHLDNTIDIAPYPQPTSNIFLPKLII